MPESLQTNTTISHYHLLQKIGAGGMGEVYLAEDTRLDRKVALKLLPAAFTQDTDRVRRFVQEAKAASALNHPNIITIHEIGEVDGTHFIATEFIDGQTLRARLAGEKLTLLAALEMAVQMASALVAAHEAGIVHRDIKPENVMLRRDGIVKVLDFGVAKLTEKQVSDVDSDASTIAKVKTEPGTVMGTASYMSPEQARGQKVDARSDIFSFGMVLYEMIAGRATFAGANTLEVISEILKTEPAPLTSLAPDAPRDLEHIVSKALRKDREERYQTVKDLLIDLKDLRRELEIEYHVRRSTLPGHPGASEHAFQHAADGEGQRGTTAAQTAAASPALTTSSAEYLVGEIKRHKLGAGMALAILLAAAVSSYFYFGRNGTTAIDSIAVLPLVNAANDPSTEYLSDGISESLINSLTELQQLRVIARSTAFRYKGKEVDPLAVGRELNVRAVLMGRVRQREDALNVQVDLVDATTGAQLWGAEYERKAPDVLAVKQAIAREVMEKLRLKLSGKEQQKLVKGDTSNAEAYHSYLRGRHLWNKRTPDGIREAIAEFQGAIDRDPNYALAHVGLADCYILQELIAGVPSTEILPKARAAVDRALQIDDSLAEAHTSSARIYQSLWRWAEVEEEFKRAISLNPNYPTTHLWFAVYLRIRHQFADAMREIKRAQELDPLSPTISRQLAAAYLLNNDIGSAVEQCQRIIELDPSFHLAHETLGWAYLKQRRYEEATAEFQKAVELSGRASNFLSYLGYCYAVTGRRAEARAVLKELEERYAKREAVGQDQAGVYAGLGEKDQAFAWLERDFEQRSGQLPFITYWFSFEDLRGDPRYADLLRRMGLEP